MASIANCNELPEATYLIHFRFGNWSGQFPRSQPPSDLRHPSIGVDAQEKLDEKQDLELDGVGITLFFGSFN